MVTHKTWYSVLCTLLGALFIFVSVFMIVNPETMIPSLMTGFTVDQGDIVPLHFAFLGNNIRNIVFGGFIIFFAFRSTKTVVLLISMRLFIEVLDLFGSLAYHPTFGDFIPSFIVMIGLEIFLILKGYQVIAKA